MSWSDPKWKYTPVAEQKAGYLAEKFRRIIKERAAKAKAEAAKPKAPVVASIEHKRTA